MATYNTGLSIGGATTTISLEINETSTNVGGNYSTVHYKLILYRSAGSQSGGADFNVVVDGNTVASGSNVSFNITSSSPRVFAEGDINIGHNSDGSKSISSNAFVNTGSGSGNAGGSQSLSNIPRYANITSVNITNVTDEGLTIAATTDMNANIINFSLDGGASYTGGNSGTSATTTFHNLISGNTYTIYVHSNASASGLDAYAGPYSATTLIQNNFMDFFDAV